MSYVLGFTPNTSSAVSPYGNYDGVTDHFFTSNGQITPSPAGISLSYSTNGVSSTQYTAILSITNNNPYPWASSWIITWGLDFGEYLVGNGTPNATASVVGRTLHLVKLPKASPIPSGGSYTVTLNLGTVGEQKSQALIKGFNGVIYRSKSKGWLQSILSNVPDGENNKSPTVVIRDLTPSSSGSGTLAYLTFLGKSAQMNNVFGYFAYQGQPPTSPSQVVLITLLPYVELAGAGGSLSVWDTYALPYSVSLSNGVATPVSYSWPQNSGIGFFVCADGWNPITSTFNPNPQIWYSLSTMNVRGEAHWAAVENIFESPNTVSFGCEDTQLVNSDKDYSDLLFQLRFN